MSGDQVVGGEGPVPVSRRRIPRRPVVLVVLAVLAVVGSYWVGDRSEPTSADPGLLPVPADPLGASVERVLADPITSTPFPGDGRVQVITRGEGGWLAAVDHGYCRVMWKSNDGVTWTPGFDEDLQEFYIDRMVGLDDGSFLAFGVGRDPATTTILRSEDGLGWETVEQPAMGGRWVVDVTAVADRVTIITGTTGVEYGQVMPGGEVWSSDDGGRNFHRIPLEGDPLVLTVLEGETLVMGKIDGRPGWWDLGGGSFPGPSAKGGISAATPLPDGGLLVRVDHDLAADWFVTTDLTTWDAIPDPPAGAHRAALQTMDGLVVSVPRPRAVAPVMVSEDGLEWSVLVSAATQMEVVGVAPGPGSSPLTAVNQGQVGALFVSPAPRFVLPPAEGGSWVEVLEESTSFLRVATGDGRVVVAAGETVYEFTGGALRPLPASGLSAGAADKVFVTGSAVFLMDGYRLKVLDDDRGWDDGSFPVGFLAHAIIENESGFVAATARPDRILISFSEDGREWEDPIEVDEVTREVWSGPRGLEGIGRDRSTVAATDGIHWEPVTYPVVGGPGSEERVDVVVPADFTIVEVRRWWSDTTGVYGRVDGRPVVLVVTGDGRRRIIPTGLVEGVSETILSIHVDAAGEVLGVETGGRVLVWRPTDG